MPDDEVYERLIGKLRSWLFDLPNSELLMPILKLRFSYEEAEFLSLFPFIPSTLDQLALPCDTRKRFMRKRFHVHSNN